MTDMTPEQALLREVNAGIAEIDRMAAQHGPMGGACMWRMEFQRRDLELLRQALSRPAVPVVVLDGEDSYEALENAHMHGCQLQISTLDGDARVCGWRNFPNAEQMNLRAFPASRYRALAPTPAPAVPEGWKLVPVEPTREQVYAGAEDTELAELCTSSRQSRHHDLVRQVYAAMLSAAPSAQASQPESAWIPVSERLPEDGQAVAFVVEAPDPSSTFSYLHGRVLGGTFCRMAGAPIFGVPGLGLTASYWRPQFEPPVSAEGDSE